MFASLAATPYAYLMPIVVVALFVMTMWMAVNVGMARKRYGIPYPTAYAVAGTPRHYGPEKSGKSDSNKKNVISEEEAYKFNCMQRGHMNMVENAPFIIALLLSNWLTFPLYSAACGLIWIVGRVLYFNGYSSSPDGRIAGVFAYIGVLGLLGMSIASSVYLYQAGSN